jgi:hypothetical protein
LARVFGPTTPSRPSPFTFWKAITPWKVLLSKTLSTLPTS